MRSIKEIIQKIKPLYYPFLIIVLVSLFFALGRISTLESKHTPIKISYMGTSTPSVLGASTEDEDGQVIGSKTGKKYYFPWCGTVDRIKPENQIVFASAAEARSNGYVAAGNCKGLK